jgi:ACS family allantoate permease-like MFS transporter
VAAIYLIAYCTGNIIGKYDLAATEAHTNGHHKVPKRSDQRRSALYTCGNHHHLLLERLSRRYDLHLVVLSNQNKKKAAFRAQPHYGKLPNQEWLDLTDRES